MRNVDTQRHRRRRWNRQKDSQTCRHDTDTGIDATSISACPACPMRRLRPLRLLICPRWREGSMPIGSLDCTWALQCSNEAGFRRFCLKQDHTGSEAEASTRIQELLKIRRCRIEQELLNLIGSFCRKRSSCSIRIFCYTEAPDKKHK